MVPKVWSVLKPQHRTNGSATVVVLVWHITIPLNAGSTCWRILRKHLISTSPRWVSTTKTITLPYLHTGFPEVLEQTSPDVVLTSSRSDDAFMDTVREFSQSTVEFSTHILTRRISGGF